MALLFPTLASGFVAKYPLKRTHKHRTAVYVHGDFSEQRFAKGTQLEEFELHFTNVKTADKETMRAFFTSTRGQLDTTWTIFITDTDGVAVEYDNCQFTEGTFSAVANNNGFWTFSLPVRQTRKN